MVSKTETQSDQRAPLTKQRVLDEAVALADDEGIEALTMRRLAERCGVEAMSLYYHVANKEAILDGLVDAIVEEIERELGGLEVTNDRSNWKAALRDRILTARKVMLRHRWAPTVIETRSTISPRIMRYMDSLLGIMREGGFSNDLGHHAMHALGSLAVGFNQELFRPEAGGEEALNKQTGEVLETLAQELPYLTGMLAEVVHDDPDTTLGWCDDQAEFEFGLDILLDGLEARLAAEQSM